MPAVLGPAAGPRNVPRNRRDLRFDGSSVTVSLSALTDGDALSRLLPPRCTLAGEPFLNVSMTKLSNLGWLAGRGYNIVKVTTGIVYASPGGDMKGEFALVLWENHADPIITGRDELASPKLFANIPDAVFLNRSCEISADWEGFRFFRLSASDLSPADPAAAPAGYGRQGAMPLMCYRHLPVIGRWNEAAIEGMAVSHKGAAPTPTVHSLDTGDGSFEFFEPRWEDMPTQYTFVRSLARLPLLRFDPVTVVRASGISDLAAMNWIG